MNKNCHCNDKIMNAFMESLKKRCTTYELNAVFKMAAIMDPRFKFAWCQDEEAAFLRYILPNEAASLTPLQTVEQSLTSQVEPPKERCKLFSFMKDNALVGCSKKGSIAEEEIAKYLSESCVSENADHLH